MLGIAGQRHLHTHKIDLILQSIFYAINFRRPIKEEIKPRVIWNTSQIGIGLL